MDTDSLYLVLAEEYFYECILLIKRVEWNENEAKIVETASEQMRKTFSPVLAAVKISNIKREPGLFKEEFRCTEMLCLCSETFCCYDGKSQKYKFSSQGMKKRALEDSGHDPMAKYRQVLDEAVNLKSTIRAFKTIYHAVATYG